MNIGTIMYLIGCGIDNYVKRKRIIEEDKIFMENFKKENDKFMEKVDSINEQISLLVKERFEND